MRISSQNNQFIFNFPENFIDRELEEKYQLLMDKNLIPYNNIMDYLNATIKDIVFPSISYNKVEQKKYHGKNINWREAGNVMDKFQGELDVTFRSVDSHTNYFIIMEILNAFYLNNKNYLDVVNVKVLDKDGDLIYTILLKSVIYNSLSELRMAYYATDFNEQTFTLQFSYNFIDIIWNIGDVDDDYNGKSIFDLGLKESDPKDWSSLSKAKNDRMNN